MHASRTSIINNRRDHIKQAGDPPKLLSRVRYYPYGLIRTQEGTLPTDKLFTGQQRETTAIYTCILLAAPPTVPWLARCEVLGGLEYVLAPQLAALHDEHVDPLDCLRLAVIKTATR